MAHRFHARIARRTLLAASVSLIGLFTPLASVDLPAQTTGRQFYVSPSGSPGNDGSISRPLDLTTALSSVSPARGGDTIWLRGGTYLGNFTSSLRGTTSSPIVVRQYPGERATIDSNTANRGQAALTVNGSDTWYWGFEVTDSNLQRNNTAGYQNPIIRMTSIDVFGARTKFINLVVHDGLQGFGFWATATDSEIYGSIVYNVGVEAPDRGHGHSIYTQNGSGIKYITDNILFNGFSFGIHAYTEGGQIDNFDIEGNTIFNHGILSAMKANVLLGGSQVAHNAVIQNNFVYNNPNVGGRGFDLGYGTTCSTPSVFNNYVSVAAGTALNLNCSGAAMIGNTYYGSVSSSVKSAFVNNTYLTSRPSGTVTFVRPNRYEAGRGNVTIYNWNLLSQVTVDLSSLGLTNGDQFEIRDAQNFFGAPVVSGMYSGSVNIPMTGTAVAQPVGNAPIAAVHTSAEFGSFVVLRTSGGSSSLPVASLTAAPVSIVSGQSATLSWAATNATSVTIDQGVGAVAATGSRTVSPASTTTYTLTAQNGSGSVTRTATVTVTPVTGGTGTAAFVRADSAIQGTWKGSFGSEGFSLANDAVSLPASTAVAVTAQANWTWTSLASEVRDLQRGSGTSRFAATWYSPSAFYIDVSVVDGRTHQLALYMLDWDNLGRVETIDVLDAVTGALLGTRSVSNFANGVYSIWQVGGHTTFRITRNAGANAVVSGLFLDPVGAVSNAPPSVTLSTSGTTFTAPASVVLTASPSDSDGTISKVDFFSNGAQVGTASGTPYTLTLSNLPAGSYTLSARATDNLGASTTSSSVAVTVNAASSGGGTNSAAFLRLDSTTQGTWKGSYGSEGSTLAYDVTALSSSVAVAFGGESSWLWSGSTTEARTLQRTSMAGRFAGTWYAGTSFTVDVNAVDGRNHQLSLYALDWTTEGRSQRFEVLDAATGTVLDTQTISNFSQGLHLVWKVSGHVVVRVTRLAGPNAVLGAVFLDPLP